MNTSRILKFLTFFCVFCDSECMKLCTNDGPFPVQYKTKEYEECDCQNTCIRTCCKPGYYFDHLACNFDNSTKPLISVYTNKTIFTRTTDIGTSIGVLECEFVYRLNQTDPVDEAYVQEDGTLWYPLLETFVSNDKYCIGGSDARNITFVCLEPSSEGLNREINTVGMMISIPFLLTTFVIYALLPKKNLNKKALMCYVLGLLISYLILVAIELSGYIEPIPCMTLGFSLIFFFLVSFCWMNVICLDIWFAFKSLSSSLGKSPYSERKKFWCYSAYAWGVPLIFIVMVILLNQFLDPNSEYHPKIGDIKCFVPEGYPKLFYFYAPISVVLTVNIILFVMTAVKIQMVNRSTAKHLRHGDSRCNTINDNRQKFQKYVRLVFAMGVNWILEVISFVSNWQSRGEVPNEVWFLTDLCNALYGVIIFFTMVFHKSILNALRERFGKNNDHGSITSAATTTSSLQSNTSQLDVAHQNPVC